MKIVVAIGIPVALGARVIVRRIPEAPRAIAANPDVQRRRALAGAKAVPQDRTRHLAGGVRLRQRAARCGARACPDARIARGWNRRCINARHEPYIFQ